MSLFVIQQQSRNNKVTTLSSTNALRTLRQLWTPLNVTQWAKVCNFNASKARTRLWRVWVYERLKPQSHVQCTRGTFATVRLSLWRLLGSAILTQFSIMTYERASVGCSFILFRVTRASAQHSLHQQSLWYENRQKTKMRLASVDRKFHYFVVCSPAPAHKWIMALCQRQKSLIVLIFPPLVHFLSFISRLY